MWGVDEVVVPQADPSPVPSADSRLVVPVPTELEMESVFSRPSRNAPCHCGSGEKYKRCHLPTDEAAWREVALRTRQAGEVCQLLRSMPSGRRGYDPEPAPELEPA